MRHPDRKALVSYSDPVGPNLTEPSSQIQPFLVRTLCFMCTYTCRLCYRSSQRRARFPDGRFISHHPLERLSAMTDQLDDQTPAPSGAPHPGLSPDAFSRRTLMASVIGGVSVVALASRFAGALQGGSKPSGLAQTGSTGPTSIGEGSPSPVASPVASPVSTATPTP